MSRQARVGLLVLAGAMLFLVVLFTIASRSFLFSDIFFVNSRFGDVAGLQPGAAVQYQGLNVGRVEDVQLPATPTEKIVVEMAIRESAHHLVTENTVAQIKTDGLVGNMIIVLVNPPELAGDPVEDGEFIPGEDPFNAFEVVDRLMVSVTRFESVAEEAQDMMVAVREGQGTLGKLINDDALYQNLVQTTTETQRLMNGLGNNAEALVGLAGDASRGLNEILDKVNNGEGTLALMLNDPGFYNELLATADTLKGISTDLRSITSGAENTVYWANLGMFRFAENMEALKHNWLFKQYFENRGYMEQADFEVREQALSQTWQKIQQQERLLLELRQALEDRAVEMGVSLDELDVPATQTVLGDDAAVPAAGTAAEGANEDQP